MTKKILRGGLLLDAGRPHSERADIIIDGDTIQDVLPAGQAVSASMETIDAAGKLLIPGLVNAHTHAQTHLAKGTGDRWNLEHLLHSYPWSSGPRKAEHHYLSAVIGAAEMIRKGCTMAYDMFAEFPQPTAEGVAAVAQAYRDAGMRAAIAPMMADKTFYQAIPGLLDALPPGPLRDAAERVRMSPYAVSVEACKQLLAKWPQDRTWVRPALAPTIPHHCSDEFLTACRDLAREHDIGMQMHVAESKVQAVVGLRKYGTTLTGHLEKLGLLGPRFTAAHGVWLDDEDMKRLGGRGASVAHNPGSNMKLGSGLAATRKMLSAGVNVAIGTDGTASSDNSNMFEAMRLALFVSRVQGFDVTTWLSSQEMLRAATESGARALGFDGKFGRLEKGYLADIAFLDLHALQFIPLNNPLNQLVHAEDGTAVDSVMIGGEMVLQNRKFTKLDIAAIAAKAEATVAMLREATTASRPIGDALEPIITQFCLGLSSQTYHVHRHVGV
jgi:guanine deaminase